MIMNINLNDKKYFTEDVKIFNNGVGGKVEQVTLTVTKKTPEDGANFPDYNLFFKDVNGTSIKEGFYYPNNRNNLSEADFNKKADNFVKRLVKIVLVAADSEITLPESNKSYQEVTDNLMTVLSKYAENKLFNIYVTYGDKNRPKDFLNLRYFDFIELFTEVGKSKLFPKRNELLTKLVPTTNLETSNPFSNDAQSPGTWPGVS